MFTTGAELVELALRDSGVCGVGQTPLAEDTNDAKRRLNMLIAQWNRKRWLTYHLVDTAFTCDNSISYTVGPGGDFNIARPAQIKAAYVRQLVTSNPYNVDFPLEQIFSREDYSQIVLKNLQAGPSQYFFYDSAYPLGSVFPWPLSDSQYALHTVTQEAIPDIGALNTNINLPEEYVPALYWNLMVWLRNAYDLPPRTTDIQQARASLNVLRQANTQVPTLRMPRALSGARAYNVWSDNGG